MHVAERKVVVAARGKVGEAAWRVRRMARIALERSVQQPEVDAPRPGIGIILRQILQHRRLRKALPVHHRTAQIHGCGCAARQQVQVRHLPHPRCHGAFGVMVAEDRHRRDAVVGEFGQLVLNEQPRRHVPPIPIPKIAGNQNRIDIAPDCLRDHLGKRPPASLAQRTDPRVVQIGQRALRTVEVEVSGMDESEWVQSPKPERSLCTAFLPQGCYP